MFHVEHGWEGLCITEMFHVEHSQCNRDQLDENCSTWNEGGPFNRTVSRGTKHRDENLHVPRGTLRWRYSAAEGGAAEGFLLPTKRKRRKE